MGFFSADLESMVELYQREAAELMEEFDQMQAEAMREGRFSAQEINAVFRVVHTIKSSAAMMGLEDISSCTHRMEDLFLLFRDRPGLAEGHEDRIFDLMYRFSDFVETENGRVMQKDFQPRNADAVLEAIQREIEFFNKDSGAQEAQGAALDTQGSPTALGEDSLSQDQGTQAQGADDGAEEADAWAQAADAGADAGAQGTDALASDALTSDADALTSDANGLVPETAIAPDADEIVWRVFLHPNCQMENARAFMLAKQLEKLCTSVATEPSNLELPGAADEIARSGLVLRLHTSREEEAAAQITSSPYVLRVEAIRQDGTVLLGADQHDAGLPGTGQPQEGQLDAGRPSGSLRSAAGESLANAAKAEDAADEDASPSRQNKFSMVSWEHVMRLQDIAGEIITADTILGASIKKLPKGGELENEFQTITRLCHELGKLVAAVSMMPVSSAMPQYYRLVRDVATKEGKQIRFKVEGEGLEIDRKLLDTLANPLVHLLRNAADHGIEPPEARVAAGKGPCGTVTLRFENMTDYLRITVEDDGAGMDEQVILERAAERGLLAKEKSQYSTDEILNLIFLPGFSTNESVNQYSGRGVGMDVAQNVASDLGGSISIESKLGAGSAITLKVPVSVTSMECIRFAVGPYACLIPIRCVIRIYSYEEVEDCLQNVDGRTWLQTEELLPVLDLFDLYGTEPDASGRNIIVIKDANGDGALLSGPIAGQQTAVEKPLPSMLGRSYRTRTGMTGCTITETGRLGMMLSADWLIDLCGRGQAVDEG